MSFEAAISIGIPIHHERCQQWYNSLEDVQCLSYIMDGRVYRLCVIGLCIKPNVSMINSDLFNVHVSSMVVQSLFVSFSKAVEEARMRSENPYSSYLQPWPRVSSSYVAHWIQSNTRWIQSNTHGAIIILGRDRTAERVEMGKYTHEAFISFLGCKNSRMKDPSYNENGPAMTRSSSPFDSLTLPADVPPARSAMVMILDTGGARQTFQEQSE